MSVGIAIMAHESRELYVQSTLERLGGVVHVSWDRHKASKNPQQRWGNGHMAWSMAAGAGEQWSLVIQDDALVSADFLAGVDAALRNVPQPRSVVSFYLGNGRPHAQHCQRVVRMARRDGVSWASMRYLYWGVAVALPTETVPDMLEWGNDPKRSKMLYDGRIAHWAKDEMGWPCWYTVPSLVDHRDEGSLIGHNVPGRRALHYQEGSALDVDWSRRPKSGTLRAGR